MHSCIAYFANTWAVTHQRQWANPKHHQHSEEGEISSVLAYCTVQRVQLALFFTTPLHAASAVESSTCNTTMLNFPVIIIDHDSLSRRATAHVSVTSAAEPEAAAVRAT